MCSALPMKLPLISSCTAKKTYEFLQAHTRPQSVMLILCAARVLCSFLHLQLNSVSMSLLLALCWPPYDRTSLQANRESSTPCLASSKNTVSLTICRGAVDRPSLTRTSGNHFSTPKRGTFSLCIRPLRGVNRARSHGRLCPK